MNKPLTLVIGSSGKTGRRVVDLLTAQGHAVRGVSRSTTPTFDWTDRSTWTDALDGVDRAYITYFPDLATAQAADDIAALVKVATAAGVRKLVLLSGRGEDGALVSEKIVQDSGLAHTIVRASWFSQNFTEGHLYDAVRDGVIAMPAADIPEPFIDADDIADIVVAALTEDRHDGEVYNITGPRLLTFAEVAAEISAATGREVTYLPVTSEQFHAALLATVGREFADLLTNLCNEVFDGRNASVTDEVFRALGRQPRDFADYCRANAHAWR